MEELLAFKRALQEHQKEERKKLVALEKEIRRAKNEVKDPKKWIRTISNEATYPILSKEYRVYEAIAKELGIYRESCGKNFDIDGFLDSTYDYEYKRYTKFQAIVSAIEVDKLINYINLENLIIAFGVLKTPVKIACRVFGMVVSFNARYISKKGSTNIEETIITMSLDEYFNTDGTFKLNKNIEWFKLLLNYILNNLKQEVEDLSLLSIIGQDISIEFDSDINTLINMFAKLLEANNNFKNLENEETSQNQRVADTTEIKEEIIPREYLNELRKYYKDGSLISIPSDMKQFSDLLVKCGVSESEKRYIYNLINEELKRAKRIRVLKYLTEEDKTIYLEALNLINSIDKGFDCLTLIEMINEINNIGRILDEAELSEDKEFLLSEMQEAIELVREMLKKPEETNKNNLLFLCNKDLVPYLLNDTNKLDNGLRKMVSRALKKIRKNNQSNFRPILTTLNPKYRVYTVLSSKVYIAFIELVKGIYLVVGATQSTQEFSEIIYRTIAYENEISKLEDDVKNINIREKILENNSKYLPLFDSLNGNIIREIKM